ncbi:MAG TPA: hypothetical protein VIX17_20055 [Pyrinomonadaceae bacterium]|jgi:hypothetical protein
MSLIQTNQLIKLSALLIIAPLLAAQDDPNWPSLSYLRSDYKAVSVVAHVRIEKAEIISRVGGYENWKINAVVIESFKGTLKKGDAFDYFHGAEAGFKQEYFSGEKIVFLLTQRDREGKGKIHYSVLENSTLPYTKDRVAKLRSIQRSMKRSRRSR